jgi:REP element-mobilizing transposase RayT
MRQPEMTQLDLPLATGWGGKRRGAGRKPAGPRARVSHAKRPEHKARHPVHVTLRAKAGLPSFRQQRIYALIAQVIRDQRRRRYKDVFRVVHFSIQSNHLHLIIEADTTAGSHPLRSGVSGLAIAIARRLNAMLKRKGKVWDDRFHRHDLTTPTETRRCLAYVFDNYVHHGERTFGEGVLDAYSTAWLFEGWDKPHVLFSDEDRWRWPVCPAKTWLLTKGYAYHGPLPLPPPRH